MAIVARFLLCGGGQLAGRAQLWCRVLWWPYLAHQSRGVTLDKRDGKSGVKALRLIHMFCTWWKFFSAQLCVATFGTNLFTLMIRFMRLKKEGIQHMTDFEDMSNAFACMSVNCRAEVLEKLINETDRPMFLERVLNSTVRYDSDEGHFFNQGPDLLLGRVCAADYSWNMRTMAWEEEHLPLLLGQAPSGLVCDLGLSALADDVAKKIVGKSEEELFEALEHSDRVLDEELEGGGWERNVDKREVVPTMKGKRLGFDLAGRGQGIVAGARHLGGRFTWNGNNREELLCRERAIRTAWLPMGRFWTVEGHWAKKRVIVGCKVLGAAVSAAETCAWHESEMQEINAVQVHEGDATRPCKNGREWTSGTVVESAATRALADSACFCGGGGEKSWMAAGDAAR